MTFLLNHLYIFLSIGFAVSSQLIIKWQMSHVEAIDNLKLIDKFLFMSAMLLNPYIMLSIVLTLLSGLSWMIAMTKFEISYAYPYTALGFIFILFFSSFFLGESASYSKILGTLLIVSGVIIVGKLE